MATIKVCDKCGERGAFSKFVLFHDQEHERHGEHWLERTKTTYDLCDKCAIELAVQIYEFADATICHVEDD